MRVPEKLPKLAAVRVLITLSAADHKLASIEAKSTGETTAEWVASLVNTALIE